MIVTPVTFDAAPTEARVQRRWEMSASFGMERNAYHNYLNEIVSDRFLGNDINIISATKRLKFKFDVYPFKTLSTRQA